MKRTLRLAAAVSMALVAASAAAQSPVTIDGTAQTNVGGVTFPDATTQTTAARWQLYAGALVVAKSGGQFSSIQAALDSISDAAANNRYLVWVAPGVYTERVTMKSWVDIEGSGPGATVITASGGSGLEVWTVLGADDAALRSLTVENTGGAQAAGIRNSNASPTLQDLSIELTGATSGNAIINLGSSPRISQVKIFGTSDSGSVVGVFNREQSSVDLRHVEIELSAPGTVRGVDTAFSSVDLSFSRIVVREGSEAQGIRNFGDAPLKARHVRLEATGDAAVGILVNTDSPTTLEHVEVEVTGVDSAWGIQAFDDVTVLHSRIEAKDSSDDRALSVSLGTTEVGNSLLDGAVVEGPMGSLTCVGAFDDTYMALNPSCQ